MATYRTGELDQRIDITRESSTPDDMGGNDVSVSVLTGAYAKVIPKNGNERIMGDKIEAPSTYMFVIRNRSDITILEKDRISWDGDQYNIDFIPKTGSRSLFLTLEASRGVAQ